MSGLCSFVNRSIFSRCSTARRSTLPAWPSHSAICCSFRGGCRSTSAARKKPSTSSSKLDAGFNSFWMSGLTRAFNSARSARSSRTLARRCTIRGLPRSCRHPGVGYLGRMPAISAIRLHFTALSASIRAGAPTSVPCGNCIGAMGVDTVYGRSLKPPAPVPSVRLRKPRFPSRGFSLSRSAERWPRVDRPVMEAVVSWPQSAWRRARPTVKIADH